MKKSPFPGMDPYLERRWGDVHTSLCTEIRTELQQKLPPGLRARAQEDVLLEDESDEEPAFFEPDVSIVQLSDVDPPATQGDLAIAVKPIAIRHVQFQKRRRWVEILDTSDGNRVVTAIEILSPGNKASGKLNRSYREKLQTYLEAGTNVVEIDLLRSSRKRLAIPATEIPDSRRADYYVCICRAKDPSLWIVYPLPLRDPLPIVPIPCRDRDKDVPLELQPIIDRIYLEGAHDDLDYSQPPEPPLSNADSEWAAGLIANRHLASS
jgi:hypothetical protein